MDSNIRVKYYYSGCLAKRMDTHNEARMQGLRLCARQNVEFKFVFLKKTKTLKSEINTWADKDRKIQI